MPFLRRFLLSALAVLLALTGASAAQAAQPAYYPSGPQTSVPVSTVSGGGWRVCFQGPFSQDLPVAQVLAQCSGTHMMLAALPTATATSYTVLAAAPRADVVFNTGNGNNTTHLANGTAWYFSTGYSWGFARGGDAVTRNSCDTMGTNAALRLCWHTGQGVGGYRAGATLGLNGDPTWTRRVLVDDAVPTTDLRIAKSGPASAPAGSTVDWTLTATNGGPDAASGVIVSDTLPAGVTFQAAPGCTYVPATRKVTCVAGALANGASRAFHVLATVDAGTLGSVTNTATVAGNETDPTPANNSASATTTIPDRADLRIVKTVDRASVVSGAAAVYRLTVTNGGPSAAAGVVVSDTLPLGVTFASVTPASCTEAAGTVTCALGTLAAGASRVVDIAVTADTPVLPAEHDHQFAVTKVEQSLAFAPGQTRSVTLDCGAGMVLTDASVRTDAVDQGTGGLDSIVVTELRSVSPSSYAITARNTATGRAQGGAFGVCVSAETNGPSDSAAGDHRHSLVVTAPVVAARRLQPGRTTVPVSCAPGSEAIAPGFTGDGLTLLESHATATGWSFTADVAGADPVDATFSVRCLSRRTSTAGGHAHDLGLTHIARTVSVAPGETTSVSLVCPDDAKGIVGGVDADAGLLVLGNDPQPKTRVFKLSNPTGGALSATLTLTCLRDRTGPVVAPARSVTNTATVSSTTPELNAADNTSSVALALDPAPPSALAPAAAPRGVTAAAPVAATAARVQAAAPALRAASLRLAGAKLAVPVTCSSGPKGCGGSVVVLATHRLAVGGKVLRSGSVLARTRYLARSASTKLVVVRLAPATARALRRARTRSVRVELRDAAGHRQGARTAALRR